METRSPALHPGSAPPSAGRSSALLALALGALALLAGPAPAATLRLNIEADPSTLGPIQSCELIANDVIDSMYEGLTAIDKDGKVVPALAERWQAHDDGKGFRFTLRKGVRFHTPFRYRPFGDVRIQ